MAGNLIKEAVKGIWHDKEILKYKYYINTLMNIICVYVLIIWVLDLVFGIHNLPGQQNGLLSDGGSTFRIINPPQVLIISFYTLYKIYYDLEEKKVISFRSMLFAGIVVLMQWRTVVAAFGVGLIITICLSLKRNGLSRKLLAEIVVLVIAICVIFLQGSSETGLIHSLMLERIQERLLQGRKYGR